MIKRYCDCCGVEIIDSNKIDDDKFRLATEVKTKDKTKSPLRIQVITAKDNCWNDGDFCKYCIIDAVNRLDDRPTDKPIYTITAHNGGNKP